MLSNIYVFMVYLFITFTRTLCGKPSWITVPPHDTILSSTLCLELRGPAASSMYSVHKSLRVLILSLAKIEGLCEEQLEKKHCKSVALELNRG